MFELCWSLSQALQLDLLCPQYSLLSPHASLSSWDQAPRGPGDSRECQELPGLAPAPHLLTHLVESFCL